MVAAGTGVARGAKVVRGTSAAKIQLDKFRAVGVPLKDDGLGPVMPERRADDEIFVDEDVRIVVSGPRKELERPIGIDRREAVVFAVSINLAIFCGKVNVRHIVVGFVDDEPAGIRMMAEDRGASRSGEKRLRKLWAGGAVVEHRWENSGFQAAVDGGAVGGIYKALADEGLDDSVFLRFG